MLPGAAPTMGSAHCRNRRRDFMAWKKPRVTEVSLALEINSYACAEVG